MEWTVISKKDDAVAEILSDELSVLLISLGFCWKEACCGCLRRLDLLDQKSWRVELYELLKDQSKCSDVCLSKLSFVLGS